MAVLTNKSIASTYKSVLSIGATTESALTTSIQQLTDGLGNSSPLSMSTTQIQFNNDANTFSFPADRGTSGQILKLADANGTLSWADDANTGTVTSVALSVPTGLTVTGSPITTSGTITIDGTLGVANGGTGATTLTGILVGNGTSAISVVSDGTVGQVLSTNANGTYSFINAAGGDVTKTGTITANQIAVWNDSTDELRSDETVTIGTDHSITLYQPNTNSITTNYIIGGGSSMTTGELNTGFGSSVLTLNTTGIGNIAIGSDSLTTNVSGYNNVAVGVNTLKRTTASNNVAIGNSVLQFDTTGYENTAIGGLSQYNITTAYGNTSLGYNSLIFNSTGIQNTAIGWNSLKGLSTYSASNNTALGSNSGSAITTGSNNVIIGSNTGSTIATSSSNIIISDGSGTIRQSFDFTGAATFSTGANRTLIIGKDSVDTGYNVVSLNGTTTKGSYSGIAGGGTSDNNLYLNSANNVVVQTGSGFSPSLTISSGGDTTITTTTNQGGLTITSATDNTTLRLINTATSGKDWRLYSTGGSSGLGAGKLFIKVGTTETSARLVSFVDDGSNINVGIGDILPTAKLQIHTETNAGGAEVAAFLVNNSSTINTEVRLAFAANTNDDISTGRYSYISAKNTSGINGQDLVFATNATGASATPKLTISSGGDVTITQPTNGNNAVLNLTAKSAGGNTRTTSLTYDANTEKLIINNAGTEILKMGSSTGVIESNYGIKFGTGTTLDAYEEGTYTATVTLSDAASGTITLSTSYNTLTYTRIGRVVTITGYCYVASVSGSPTGTISINLPFNPASGETFYSAASVEFNNVVSSALNEFWCQVVPNSIQIYRSTGTSVSATTAQQMQTGTDFRVCATYFI